MNDYFSYNPTMMVNLVQIINQSPNANKISFGRHLKFGISTKDTRCFGNLNIEKVVSKSKEVFVKMPIIKGIILVVTLGRTPNFSWGFGKCKPINKLTCKGVANQLI